MAPPNTFELKDREPSHTDSVGSRGKAVDRSDGHACSGKWTTHNQGPAFEKRGDAGESYPVVDRAILTSQKPSYAQDLGAHEVTHGLYGSLLNGLGSILGVCGMVPCCPVPNPFREVQQGSVGLVSRFGQFYKSVDPGLVQVNICTEALQIVDVKIQIIPIGRQGVITRDNVNVEIDSVIYYQINNPYRSAFGISDLRKALIERAQTTLRQVVGAARGAIVSDVADNWGVAIEGILIKDIIFSADVSASLSSAAQQKRLGESKVIAARAEVDSAKLMRQAADILASPAAMQIRQLEALQAMAKSGQSKVIFVPMQLQSDIAGQLAGGGTVGPSDHGEGSSSL
ncbi:hypothetical protein B0H14DRAFT_3464599 [Mycena olivaceomarginata]|nr:hypothetical protein B0H14DRAFT_3464599 [Mycena olivaceomarginata]